MTNEQLKSKEFHSQNLPQNLLKHSRTTKNVSEYLKMLYNDIAWLRGRAAHTDFWNLGWGEQWPDWGDCSVIHSKVN